MNEQLIAPTIRGLAMDGVQKANSGHPGMPLGTADLATVLWFNFLKLDPATPAWPDRDRMVLSAGHGSMLLYSLLHLFGYLPLEQLKQFRQWGSLTPGHPEYGHTPGVETTTGPLGQGCGNAVGMALAEAMLAARFNRPRGRIVDHYTYALAGDGDLMEGISHEAFSLAGHLGLHKLTVLYDSNRITIEGSTELACSDDVRRRFQAYHWRVQEIDGHDHAAIAAALLAARRQRRAPTLILAHTHIAHGTPHAHDTAESHGAPLGVEEIRATKIALGLPPDQDFYIPDAVRKAVASRMEQWQGLKAAWDRTMARYRRLYPELAAEWDACQRGDLPTDLERWAAEFKPDKPMASRQYSGLFLQTLAAGIPNLVGGSADLAPSNNTVLKNLPSVAPGRFDGRNLHFGIREHAMGAVLNGMALHGGWRVYGATFLVFSDYLKPALRLASLMRLPVIYVMTHDSIFLGEDGPTHQPVEQLAALRSIPGVTVVRPADAQETAAAWCAALENQAGPTVLVLSRQTLPLLTPYRTSFSPAQVRQGAYVIWDSRPGLPDLILIATGSEVALALETAQQLAGCWAVRVVSMPSWEWFDQQPAAYRQAVLPDACVRRFALEAAVTFGWERYTGRKERSLGLSGFGASAPASVLAREYRFTAAAVAAQIQQQMTELT